MDDQSPLIKSTSGRSNYYRSDNNSDKPSGTPGSSKNFKKILNDDSDAQSSASDTIDAHSDENEVGSEKSGIRGQTAAAPAPVVKSPFSLVKSSEFKGASPKMASATADAKNSNLIHGAKDSLTDGIDLNQVDPDGGSSNFDSELAEADKPVSVPNDSKATTDAPTTKKPAAPLDSTQKVEVDAAKKDQVGLASLDKLKTTSEYSEAEIDRLKGNPVPNKKLSKEDSFNNEFGRGQNDLSFANPLAIPGQQNLVTSAEVQTARPLTSANLQSLVEQLVKELSVMQDGDKTETSIVLNNPPQFDGVKITITAYESSRNDFNLKFENLTPQAQLLVNQQQNRADLMSNLEKKGYNVHIFIASTYSETNPLTASIETSPNGRDRQSDRDEQQRQQKERDQEDER